MDRLQHAISQAKRNKTSIAVIFLDLDGFKPVNDTYGHETGDKLLIEIAKRLSKNLRECDTVARIGGDEFVLLIPQLEHPDHYELALQRILNSINQPVHAGGKTVTVSASIGLSQYPSDATDPDILLRLPSNCSTVHAGQSKSSPPAYRKKMHSGRLTPSKIVCVCVEVAYDFIWQSQP